jgi:tryptophan halogenase
MSMMAQDKVFFPDKDGRPRLHGNIAYHFENEKFVAYLEAFATHSGVEIVEDTIRSVRRDDAGVAELSLASGRSESADLYVDCSGFKSLLLGETLKEPFVTYSGTLFCDRAVVGGWQRTTEPIHPYTTSESMSTGWAWQIEHVNRINRGYVYSSGFISDEDAEREFRQKNPKVEPTRIVKFVSGRTERAWVGNVVAIGNSSGFVEPLEATALGMIGTRSQLLAQTLIESDRQIVPYETDLYNASHRRAWDTIRDFLACHYRFNHHLTTPFWRHCQNETDLAGSKPMVEYYQEFGPTGTWGPILVDPLCGFGPNGYLMILIGQKVPYKRPYTPSPQERETWNKLVKQNFETARGAMTVAQALRALGVQDMPVDSASAVKPSAAAV